MLIVHWFLSGMPLPIAHVEESWQMAEFYSNKVCFFCEGAIRYVSVLQITNSNFEVKWMYCVDTTPMADLRWVKYSSTSDSRIQIRNDM
jgi:hypothetical protein